MKFFRPLLLAFATLAAGSLLSLTGCASLDAPNTESLLSAAGFWTKTPTTPKQIAFFQSLEAYDLTRHTVNGHVLYAYADEANNVVYFGSQQDYQRYQKLALKQQVAEENLVSAEMNEDAELDWDSWGPWGSFWE